MHTSEYVQLTTYYTTRQSRSQWRIEEPFTDRWRIRNLCLNFGLPFQEKLSEFVDSVARHDPRRHQEASATSRPQGFRAWIAEQKTLHQYFAHFANLANSANSRGLCFGYFRLFAVQEFCPMRSFPFESRGPSMTNQRRVFRLVAWFHLLTFRLAS